LNRARRAQTPAAGSLCEPAADIANEAMRESLPQAFCKKGRNAK